MPRYSGGTFWPYTFVHQPGGWAEQTSGAGFGNRNGRLCVDFYVFSSLLPPLSWSLSHAYPSPLRLACMSMSLGESADPENNDVFSSLCSGGDSPGLDSLSSLVARLILQNHLTRLGDAGCHGGALWGCNPPPSSPAVHCHGVAPANRCQLPCVHTCPNAGQPYMGTNNVFVIPASQVHQQPQMAAAGLAGMVSPININTFLSGLGLGPGGTNPGCGGGLNLSHGFNPSSSGAGFGAHINLNRFSCPSCNIHL